MNQTAAKAALAYLELDENPVSVRAKSRSFFGYSPAGVIEVLRTAMRMTRRLPCVVQAPAITVRP